MRSIFTDEPLASDKVVTYSPSANGDHDFLAFNIRRDSVEIGKLNQKYLAEFQKVLNAPVSGPSDLMGCPLIELDASWRLDEIEKPPNDPKRNPRDPKPKRSNFQLGKLLVGILVVTWLLIIGTLIYCWYDRSRAGRHDLDEPMSMASQRSGWSLPSWFHRSLNFSNFVGNGSSAVESKGSGVKVESPRKEKVRPSRMVQTSGHGNSSLNPQEWPTIETIDSNTGEVINPRKQGKPSGSPKAKKVL